MDELIPIGEVARRSGLPVSALRFYDGEGVLRPEAVDSVTGYRRYAPAQARTARLVAGLRRVGMPIAEIREAVEHAGDVELVSGLLEGHLSRLEAGLADARREIARLRTSFAEDASGPEGRVGAAELARLIDAVRFAIGSDPETPVLHGALLEIEPGLVRLVATDRYRLAVHEVAAETSGRGAGVLAVDGLAALAELTATAGSDVHVVLGSTLLSARAGEHSVQCPLLDGDYPDYRRILADRRDGEIPCDDGLVSIGVPTVGLATVDGPDPVVVRHEFLLGALAAAGEDATLRLDGPIAPLAIRAADGALSLLMPTRVES